MPDSDKNRITDLPVGSWLTGLFFLAIAAYLFKQEPQQPVVAAVPAGLGLLILALASIKIVTVDHASNQLVIRSIGLIPGKKKEIPIQEIASVEVDSTRSQSSRSNSPTYRVVIRCKDGSEIPLRNTYSSGLLPKQKRANELRALIGVGGTDLNPAGLFNLAAQLSQKVSQEQQEALTGSQAEEHIKDGVRWFLQTRTMGGTGVTRWFSPDAKFPDGFLYLAQKAPGQKSAGGGIFGGFGALLIKQSLSLYGFGGEETPGLDTASLLANPDPALDEHFMGFTSSQTLARQVLSPWAVKPLADWGRRYPLKTISSEAVFNQLAILFSPQGLYIATLGVTIPEAVEELTALGVELVKTQTSL